MPSCRIGLRFFGVLLFCHVAFSFGKFGLFASFSMVASPPRDPVQDRRSEQLVPDDDIDAIEDRKAQRQFESEECARGGHPPFFGLISRTHEAAAAILVPNVAKIAEDEARTDAATGPRRPLGSENVGFYRAFVVAVAGMDCPARTSTAISATSVGVRPTRTPFASSARAFAAAVPAVPETIAPA